jgi:hypothetical protein
MTDTLVDVMMGFPFFDYCQFPRGNTPEALPAKTIK